VGGFGWGGVGGGDVGVGGVVWGWGAWVVLGGVVGVLGWVLGGDGWAGGGGVCGGGWVGGVCFGLAKFGWFGGVEGKWGGEAATRLAVMRSAHGAGEYALLPGASQSHPTATQTEAQSRGKHSRPRGNQGRH